MKNILLCNNKMEIGGVETVILNQVVAFKKKGYNVYVIAGKGCFSNEVEKLGGNFIEQEFKESNNINTELINKIVKIINENQITEIHIHKYQCLTSVLMAAFITNTPYFAYDHAVWDTKKYYTWNYPIYKELFPIFFKNAYKIIAITPSSAKFTMGEYNIPSKKYEIIHNGIDLDLYKNENPNYNSTIENVIIISRICDEKLPTIFEGIDIFKKILEKNEKAKLNIIGDGDKVENVKEYIEKLGLKLDNQVELLGAKNNIIEYLKDTDLLLGVDRCILEAIAMKVPAVITGYNGIKGLVKKENIEKAIEENFSGNNMETIAIEECMKEIEDFSKNKKNILEENHKIAEEKLDCYKNYINIPEETKINFDWVNIFEILKKQEDLIQEQSKDVKAKYEWIQKIEKENKELWDERGELRDKVRELEWEINQKQKENEEEKNKLRQELDGIYNSKKWKYAEKIGKVFHMKD